ncbi:MAG: hypothetical protein R3E84_11455 [Pseudomonadales bacterium]
MTASKPVNLPKSVDFMVADMSGVPRGKVIDGTRFEDGELPHMANAVFFQAVTGEYGDATTRYNPKDEDILLAPDWDTYRPVPWRGEEHGQVICRALNKNRQPVPYDPRHALSMVLERYASRGLFPAMAPEVEFYLLEPSADWNAELRSARGRNPRMGGATDSFSIDGLTVSRSSWTNSCASVRARLKSRRGDGTVRAAGAEFPARGRDVAGRPVVPAQGRCAPPRKITAMWRRSWPNRWNRHAGQRPGMCTPACSLDASGRNVFTSEDGVAAHVAPLHQRPAALAAGGVCAHCAKRQQLQTVRSRQLRTHQLHRGYDNRTAGIRVPYGKDNAGRVESRVAGADANPYLHFAATLAAGWLGLEQQVEPTSPFTGTLRTAGGPAAICDWALAALGASREVRSLLGDPLVDVFISVKQAELHHYRDTLSPWERRYLLDL